MMLIGKFAKYFNVNVDTVRYYMKLDLLLPKKQNHYFYFDETCVEDMEFIQELKEFRFSLKEIGDILSLKRVTSLSNDDDITFFKTILENKKKILLEEVAVLTETCKLIDEKVQIMQSKSAPLTVPDKGIDFSFIALFHCPTCASSLELKDTETKGQQIFNSKLYCLHCDYQATIEEGIMITKHLSEKSYNPFYIYDTEMLKKIQSSFVNISEKSSFYVKQKLLNHHLREKVILEPNVDTYVFLDKYLLDLDIEAKYIFTGSTLPMLKMLKRKIERINPNLHVLYLLNSGMDLPFRHECIDYVIDSYSFNEFSLFNNRLPMQMLAPYLSQRTMIIGCYFQYHRHAESLLEMKHNHPYAYSNNLRETFITENMAVIDFAIEEKVLIGKTNDPGKYIKYHIPGEEAKFYVYTAGSKLKNHVNS